tara:strand:+ start:371 stop:1213 length:843 start_codon:yes stop_codon:yes gene_type:complete
MTLLPRIGWDTKLGSLNAFYGIERSLSARDRVITPAESISKAIRESSAGGLDPDGVRLYLAPGKYFIKKTIDISRSKIHLIAAVPGQSVIIYNCTPLGISSSSTANDPALKISGDECSLRGLKFEESVTASQINAAGIRSATGVEGIIQITGHGCVIDDCHFGFQTTREFGIQIVASNFTRITNNVFENYLTYAVQIKSASQLGIVSGNSIRNSPASSTAIYAEDDVGQHVFLGNVVSPTVASSSVIGTSRPMTSSRNSISYKIGQENVNAGNVGTVTER